MCALSPPTLEPQLGMAYWARSGRETDLTTMTASRLSASSRHLTQIHVICAEGMATISGCLKKIPVKGFPDWRRSGIHLRLIIGKTNELMVAHCCRCFSEEQVERSKNKILECVDVLIGWCRRSRAPGLLNSLIFSHKFNGGLFNFKMRHY